MSDLYFTLFSFCISFDFFIVFSIFDFKIVSFINQYHYIYSVDFQKFKNMKVFRFIFLLIILPVAFGSCNKRNRFAIDTQKDRVVVKIHRFDRAQINLDTLHLNASMKSLYKNFPEFIPQFCTDILDTNYADTTVVSNLMLKFLRDTTFSKVNRKEMSVFNDISGIESRVSDAFTYIHHYFPTVHLPEVYFYVSGFNRQVILNDKFIGLGTDLYLGNDYSLYQSFTYQYLQYNMRPESVPVDLVSATLFRMFVMNSSQDRLLDNMIFRGKIMYLLSVFMPDEKPENIMGYTPKQWKWCEKYERQIWGSIIDQKYLFSTDVLLIRKFMNEAPFTAPVSQDSPGRLGTWVGWQIVKNYMNNNSKQTIQNLMNQNDAQKILEDSGYRP